MPTQTVPTTNGATAPGKAKGTKADKPGKKSRRKPLLILVVVLLVALVGADKFLLKKPKPTHAVSGKVLSLPQTTLNLPDGQLLQVSLAVQVQKGVGDKKGAIPAGEVAQMEDDEITVLSSFPETTLLSTTGKDKARQALLGAFRSVVGPGPVGPGVMAVYFTDFVMQ